MIIKSTRKERKRKRHFRIRTKVVGTHERPRLSLYKSNKHIYAQIIDDEKAHTLLSCSTLHKDLKNELKATWTLDSAKRTGEIIAKRALEKGIKFVVFDRGGNKYHGKVQAFAEGARTGGLKF